MAEAVVREASGADARAIAGIQARTWRYAYADLLPAEALAELEPEHIEGRWSEVIAAETDTLLALEGTEPVGCCVCGAAPHAELLGVGGELPGDAGTVGLIGTLFVEPRWGRRGHGGRLLATAAGRLRARGFTRGITWIPEADHAALSFYERAGWRADGLVRTLDTGGGQVREARLTGTLDLHLE
ncbi:GNAT family N-acetyltransferase [Sciscionella marina]|uniref:GNAT family N-acetyltransferase n=1 Tax=Sciscionella marina TaxID=508770 RepID=UPI00036F097F|nr:GNAT family N-acetyltransferase [Sciscionella marina]